MTHPMLENCAHIDNGICLECSRRLKEQYEAELRETRAVQKRLALFRQENANLRLLLGSAIVRLQQLGETSFKIPPADKALAGR